MYVKKGEQPPAERFEERIEKENQKNEGADKYRNVKADNEEPPKEEDFNRYDKAQLDDYNEDENDELLR